MTRDTKDLIVGLDIGTSKVVAVVAEMQPDGRYEVVGLGQHESRGLKKGVVVNIEATVASIQRALEEAELMADCKIRNVYTGIAGSHIRSFNSIGMVAITWAYTHVEASRAAPLEYTGLVWAALLGWLAFGEIPTVWSIGSAALIVLGCLLLLRR